MNNLFKVASFVFLIFMFSAQSFVFAKTGTNKTNNGKDVISAKCHLTFTNGREEVVFWRVRADKLATLSKDIVGKSIEVPHSKGKFKIYKAFQCVSSTAKFSSNQAKLLDPNPEDR